MNLPALNGVDHLHLYVTDKQSAVNWYAENLGFKVVESLRFWDGKNGPLTIEDQSGTIHLAIFESDAPQLSTAFAFATSGPDFIRWRDYLNDKQIALRIADHQVTWSMYFSDPFGNSHEITSDDYATIKNSMQ